MESAGTEDSRWKISMHWLFYSSHKNQIADSTEAGLKEWTGAEQVDVCHGAGCLDLYLSKPHRIITHAVVLCFAHQDLLLLAKFRRQLNDWRLILGIVGPVDQDTLKIALQFHPRYVAWLPEEIGHLHQFVAKTILNNAITLHEQSLAKEQVEILARNDF
jgi:hypothetical protein